MGVILYSEPELKKPDMLACWPGIGNVGVIAVEALRGQVRAEEFGEIEPFDFFYPRKVVIKAGILENLEFPSSKFYYKRLEGKDLIFFIGDEQPGEGGRTYAEGKKAYEMAGMVLDVAQRFGCQRIYTSGAAVHLTHHAARPRVWAVTTKAALNKEITSYENTVLMSEIEGMGDQGSITGLNGLLLGLAKKRGFDGICLMGEVPDYLSRAPLPFPRASKSVLGVFSALMGTKVDFSTIDEMISRVDTVIDGIFQQFPEEIRQRIEQRKSAVRAEPETISEEDGKWIKEHIDELFKPGSGRDERGA